MEGKNKKNEAESKPALELWGKIIFSFENIRRIQAKTVFEDNLTPPQYNVLEVLYLNGPMSLKKISQKLYVSGANITCVIDNLEKEDLVKRVFFTGDRRVINAELTEKGKAKMKSLFPQIIKNLSEIIAPLEENEQKDLIRLLGKLDVSKTDFKNPNL